LNTAPSRQLRSITSIAAKLFAKSGYHGTSMSDISQATGLGRGALYYHIKSKEDLLWECHNVFIEPILESAYDIERSAGTPEVKLRALSETLLNMLDEYRPFVRIFHRELSALSKTRLTKLVQRRREYEDLIERVVRAGIAEGEFEVEDARVSVLTFLGIHNWTFEWFNPRGRLSARELSRQFMDIFLRGIQRGSR
jgi:TetR/AcrR family transcriptional regulator, cholesterol catabolism regulator